jgi:hypothetical protein
MNSSNDLMRSPLPVRSGGKTTPRRWPTSTGLSAARPSPTESCGRWPARHNDSLHLPPGADDGGIAGAGYRLRSATVWRVDLPQIQHPYFGAFSVQLSDGVDTLMILMAAGRRSDRGRVSTKGMGKLEKSGADHRGPVRRCARPAGRLYGESADQHSADTAQD